jgi:hypothetical protein
MSEIKIKVAYDPGKLTYTLNQLVMLGYKWRSGANADDIMTAFPGHFGSLMLGHERLEIYAIITDCGEKLLTGSIVKCWAPTTLNILPVRNSKIEKVIFNNPATVVFWKDGTKTVVKAHGEKYDPEKGLAMAIAKKYFGNEGNYFNNMRPWLDAEKEKAQNAFEEWIRKELCKEE